jgi:uncharacterized protein (DUF58 family)
MKGARRILAWLETHGAVPAYAGWVLIGLTICFWIAAANTMAGWLYVLSGLGAALLSLSAALPVRTLKGIEITRAPLLPIHVGEPLVLTLSMRNLTRQPKGLLSVQDQTPPALGDVATTAIDTIAPQSVATWQYRLEPQRRGVYQWQTLALRTGAPLGLFWSRRTQQVRAEAIVYPRILPLARCPILDDAGASAQQIPQFPVAQTGQEGSTRSLRPYRWGDPMRMVHWRSSARFNELRIRELELFSGGQTFVIGLDTSDHWEADPFEQAVMAAASLYCYAAQHHGSAQLWTAQWGMVQGEAQVLEVLARIKPEPECEQLPDQATIWLTAQPYTLKHLPRGSRYILWGHPEPKEGSTTPASMAFGFCIDPQQPLQLQLQSALPRML